MSKGAKIGKRWKLNKLLCLVLLTLITVTVLTGCATEGPKFLEASPGFTPKRVYEGNLDKLYSTINRTLDENRIAVVSADKSAGRIQTDYIQGVTTAYVLGLGGIGSSRYSYNIRINEEGLNKVKVIIIGKLEQSLSDQSGSTPYRDLTQTNIELVKGLENWLYQEIEKRL